MADESPEEPRRRREEPPPIEWLKPGETQTPTPSPEEATPAAWVPKPEDYRIPTYAAGPAPPRAAGGRRRAAAVCLILAGLLGIASQLSFVLFPPTAQELENRTAGLNATPGLEAALNICALLSVWGQALAVLGGVMAYRGINWKLVLACAGMAVFTLGFFGEASILGVLGILLVFSSRGEFSS